MKTLKLFAILTVLAAASMAVCHAPKTVTIKKTTHDIPRCIPHPPDTQCP
jgi:hypothetical protein